MKRITLLAILCLATAMTMSAYDFMVGGLCYNKNPDGKSVTVTYYRNVTGSSLPSYSDLSGDLIIPESVNYNGTYTVTAISNSAFRYCRNLTSVIIPGTVTTIGYGAFGNCSGLTSVTIPNSVSSIGESVFSYCIGLTSVTIPNSVTSISKQAFENCSGLTSVTIPNSVTSISKQAFENCSGLTSVTIPNSVTVIGGAAFSGCSALPSITIPSFVTTIDNGAFYKCSSLSSITIPSSVTTIGSGAFFGCTSLKNVNWNAINCDDSPFRGMQSITSVKFGSKVNKIPSYFCSSCHNLTSVTIGKSVTEIGDCAFEGCNGLTSVTIPNSVTTIGGKAFTGCSGLTSVTIPNSVTTISYDAFYSCTGLSSVTIPNSVTTIGSAAFSGCIGLTSVTIPNSVTSIGREAFSGCTGMTSVTIPNSVSSIGERTFSGCSGLTSVTIPNSVTEIGEYAFSSCTGLSSVTIPNSVTSVDGGAFAGCSGLTSVSIPNSVTTIGGIAFRDCSGLTSIHSYANPNNIILGTNVFLQVPTSTCQLHVLPGYRSIYKSKSQWQDFANITEDLKYDSSCLKFSINADGKSAKVIYDDKYTYLSPDLEIPAVAKIDDANYSVTAIDNSAFSGCTSLTSVTIPNSVKEIGISAFTGCSNLTSVSLGNSITAIGNYAFKSCRGLADVYSTIENPASVSMGSSVFEGVPFESCALRVPRGTVSTYRALEQWKDFTLIYHAKVESISMTNQVSMSTGSSTSLDAQITPSDAYESISWSSGNTNVAIVDQTGKVTAKMAGTATITASATDGSGVTDSCQVTVTDNYSASEGPIYFNATEYDTMSVAGEYTISKGGITITVSRGLISGAFRIYASQTITVTSSIGNITDIQFTCAASGTNRWGPGNFTATSGEYTYSGNVGTWTGSSSSVCLTALAQVRATEIVVTTSGATTSNLSGEPLYILGDVEGSEWNYSGAGIQLEETDYHVYEGTFSITNAFCFITNNQCGSWNDLLSYRYGPSGTESSLEIPSVNGIALGQNSSAWQIGISGKYDITVNLNTMQFSIAKHNGIGTFSYRIANGEAYLVRNSNYSTMEDFSIPSTVKIDGNEYEVVGIDSEAFAKLNNSRFMQINIPSTVRTIGENAFAENISLQAIVVDKDNNYYCSENGVLYDKKKTTLIAMPQGYQGTSFVIPNGVSEIYQHAFRRCSKLTQITIPNSVTSIGHHAFYGCPNLTSINIPKSVTSIGTSAFASCSSLNSIAIPNSVTSIGNSVFANCTSLKEASIACVISSSSVSIFKNCSNLNKVIWSVKNCGDFTESSDIFTGCTALQTVIVSEDVDILPAYFMYGVSSLKELTLGKNVTDIKSYAFSGCEILTGISLPPSVTTIWNNAFENCTSLKSLEIPESIKSVGTSAFAGCSGLTAVKWNATLSHCTYSSSSSPFYGLSSIKSFEFGDQVKYIPSFLCENLTGLTMVEIPESVSKVGDCPFSGCTSLKQVKWNAASCNNFSIEPVWYGDEIGWVKTLPPFHVLSNIQKITFGPNVETIPAYLCYSLQGLTEIIIPNSVTDIGDFAFAYCLGVTKIEIGESVKNIGASSFISTSGQGPYITTLIWNAKDCAQMGSINNALLKTAIIGEKVEVIPDYFAFLSKISTIVIPNSVVTIGKSAFSACKLTSVQIPCSVRTIGTDAFRYNNNMKSLSIANSVEQLGDNAFADCSGLTTVSLPSTLTSIGSTVFTSPLQDLYVHWKSPISITDAAFSQDIYTGTVLHVPGGSASSYRGKVGWKNFSLINGDSPIIAEKIELNIEEATITQGETLQLYATISPIEASPNVVWESDNTLIASVDENGNVNAIAEGQAIISAHTSDGSDLFSTCLITILGKPDFLLTSTPIKVIRGMDIETQEIAIALSNKSPISALRFDMELSEQMYIPMADNDYQVWIDADRKTRNHSLWMEQSGENKYQVNISSLTDNVLKGDDGDVMHLYVAFKPDADVNDPTITFSNIEAVEPGFVSHQLADTKALLEKSYIVGDANGDARVDAADYVAVAMNILKRQSDVFWEDAADVNNDGSIDITDLMRILSKSVGTDEQELRLASNDVASQPEPTIIEDSSDRIFIAPTDISSDESGELELCLDNQTTYTAFQTDLYLPEGISVAIDDGDFIIDPTGRKARSHTLNAVSQSDGAIRIFVTSQQLQSFTGSNGAIATINITTSDELSKPATIRLANSIVVEPNGIKHTLADETLTIGGNWLKGDINGDDAVDGGDISILLEMVLEGGVSDQQMPLADLNGDGDVDGGDVSILLEIVLDGE